MQMLSYETGEKWALDSFYRLNARAETLCRRRLARHSRDAHGYLYLGLCRLSLANALGWERRRVQALQVLLGAAAPLEKARELDSTLRGVCYGLGMVEYFRSRADKYLLSLGILGSRDRALNLLRRAAADSGPCAAPARFALAWILGQEQEYEKALVSCHELLRSYPENRMVMRTMRDIRLRKADYDSVLAVGRRLQTSILRAFPRNRYYLAENWLVMAKAFRGLVMNDSCLRCLDKVIAWEQYQEEVPWLPVYVAEAKGLKRELQP